MVSQMMFMYADPGTTQMIETGIPNNQDFGNEVKIEIGTDGSTVSLYVDGNLIKKVDTTTPWGHTMLATLGHAPVEHNPDIYPYYVDIHVRSVYVSEAGSPLGFLSNPHPVVIDNLLTSLRYNR